MCVFLSPEFLEVSKSCRLKITWNHSTNTLEVHRSLIFNGHSERRTWPFSRDFISSTISVTSREDDVVIVTFSTKPRGTHSISRENAGPLWDGGPLISCLTSPVGALWKMIYPRNTSLYYIRCIWGWLLRVPSQGYQPFSYESVSGVSFRIQHPNHGAENDGKQLVFWWSLKETYISKSCSISWWQRSTASKPTCP